MKKAAVFTLLALFALVLYGCGSGDYSDATTVVTGAASKGPITGGTVKVFEITTSAHQGKLLATATPQAGSFSASLGTYKGAIFATMSGGTYTSEATGASAALPQKLRAATYISKSGPLNLAITPMSELAFRRMSSLTPARIENANTRVTSLYVKGLSSGKNVVNTLPADVLNSATAKTTDADRINYGLALATVSQMMTSASLESVITTLGNALATSDTTAYLVAFAALPTTNLQTGVKATPLSVALTPSKTSGVAGTGDTITFTATVTGFGGTASSGTTVAFAVTSGSGTLSSSTATTNSSGIATVTLSSSVIGTAVVTATAGTATANQSVVFGQNPNDPVTVTLTGSPSAVAANGTSTITLTANVLAVSGSSVPDGTTVTFAVTSGSGTLSAVSATTASGTASVTMTSSTIGSVTVTATATTALGVAVKGATTVAFVQDPTAAASVAVTSSASSAVSGTSVTITAAVTTYAGNAIADGTTVSFAVTSGSGTLSAASAATSGGSASVTLTGTATGSVTVTATTGGKSGSKSVAFTARPTKAIVTLSTSGTFTSGSTIGALNCDVIYPTAKGLTFSSAALSGVTTSISPTPTLVSNVTTAGDLSLGLQANLSGSTTVGFPLGQFVTATFTIPSGTTLPVTGDFAVASGWEVDNTSGAAQSGLSVTILGVTFQ